MAEARERAQTQQTEERRGSLISGLLPLLCLCPLSFFMAGEEGGRNMSRGKEGTREEENENGERQKPINMQMRKDDVMNEARASFAQQN